MNSLLHFILWSDFWGFVCRYPVWDITKKIESFPAIIKWHCIMRTVNLCLFYLFVAYETSILWSKTLHFLSWFTELLDFEMLCYIVDAIPVSFPVYKEYPMNHLVVPTILNVEIASACLCLHIYISHLDRRQTLHLEWLSMMIASWGSWSWRPRGHIGILYSRLKRSRSKLLSRRLASQHKAMRILLPVFLLMSVAMLFMTLTLSRQRTARRVEFFSLHGELLL